MQASETRLFKLLQGQQHYMVPLFQRPYSWDKDNWETLWKDILEVYDMGAEGHHFLGSLVTKSLAATLEGVSPFIVIDGQQRLTTLMILLAVLRDAVKKSNETEARKLQNLYLTNEYASGLQHLKVLPTQFDRQAFSEVIESRPSNGHVSLIHQAAQYFRTQLAQPDPSSDDGVTLDLDRLEQVILSGLELVSITLDEADNEYLIFQSLNGKGTPLTQADLIRNYFFMRMPVTDHESAYSDFWLPMQESLGSANLEDFFRYELMSLREFVRQGDIYFEWNRRLERTDPYHLVDELLTLTNDSRFFKRLIEPTEEPNADIRRGLDRLNRWGGQTIYPFLLYVYRRYEAEEITVEEFVQILRIVESFLVRRLFANVPTNALNRVFLRLAFQLPEGAGLVEGTRMALSEPSRRWPRDDQFIEAIAKYPLFTDSRPNQRRLILESLEQSYGHKGKVEFEGLSVEHIMPQTLTPE